MGLLLNYKDNCLDILVPRMSIMHQETSGTYGSMVVSEHVTLRVLFVSVVCLVRYSTIRAPIYAARLYVRTTKCSISSWVCSNG